MSGEKGGDSNKQSLDLDDPSENPIRTPNPTPRVSLPVRFSNPENPNSERPVEDITPDSVFVRSDILLGHTTDLVQNVSVTLGEVDSVLATVDSQIRRRILDQSIHEENMAEENQTTATLKNPISISEERSHSEQNTRNEYCEGLQEGQNFTSISQINQSQEIRHETIGLEAALKLLPNSFSGEKQEDTEIFLEKCEFALECAHESVKFRLLKGIQVRLIGKARQAVRFKTITKWSELREALKSALEPQRTTTYLFSELYSSKQKYGEDIMSYSNRIEQLQTLILEQETDGKSREVAQALEASIKKQTIQVFIEGMGPLKDFIKARNPSSLEKAVQAAREEERVRTSYEETKKLYGTSRQSTVKKPICFNCEKIGHMAKDCQSTSTGTKSKSSPSTQIRSITCHYCKKPGHLLKDCRKRNYVKLKNGMNQLQGNGQQPAISGGRPVSELKNTVSDKLSTSKQN